MTTSTTTNLFTFEIGKVYVSLTRDGAIKGRFRVTKITTKKRYSTRYRQVVEDKWITFERGYIRGGEFHLHTHYRSNKIRRKVDTTSGWAFTEYVWETPSHLNRIEAVNVQPLP